MSTRQILTHEPDPPGRAEAPYQKFQSTATVRASANLEFVPQIVSQALPSRFDGTAGWGLLWNAQWLLGRYSTDVKLESGRVAISTQISGVAYAHVSQLACALAPLIMNANASGVPQLIKTQQGWGVGVAGPTATLDFDANSDRRCFVGGVIDVSDKVRDSIFAPQASRLIDKLKEAFYPLPLQEPLTRAGRPFPVRVNETSELCVALHPVSLATSVLQGTFAQASIVAALAMYPRAVLTQSGCGGPADPSEISAGVPPTDDRFRVEAEVFIPLTTGVRTLGKKRTSRFRSVRSLGVKGQLVSEISVRGPVNGSLYVWAEPSIEGTKVRFKNFALTDASKNAIRDLNSRDMIGIEAWLDERLSNQPVDFSNEIENSRAALSRRFQMNGLTLDVSLESAHISSVKVLDGGILASVLFEGRAELNIEQTLVSDSKPKAPKIIVYEDIDFGGRSLEIFENQPSLPWPFRFREHWAETSSIRTNLAPGEWVILWEEENYDVGQDQLWVTGTTQIANLHQLRRQHGNNEWGDRIRGVSFVNFGPGYVSDRRTVIGRDCPQGSWCR